MKSFVSYGGYIDATGARLPERAAYSLTYFSEQHRTQHFPAPVSLEFPERLI